MRPNVGWFRWWDQAPLDECKTTKGVRFDENVNPVGTESKVPENWARRCTQKRQWETARVGCQIVRLSAPTEFERRRKEAPMAVFISYATARRAEAVRFAELLETEGIATFLAHRDIAPGQSWPKAITRAVRSADAVTVLFCRESDQSRHVSREVTLADQFQIPYFPVRLETADADGLMYFFSTTQWFDWNGEDDRGLEALVAELQRVSGRADMTTVSDRAARTASIEADIADADAADAADFREHDGFELDKFKRDGFDIVIAENAEKMKTFTDDQLVGMVLVLRDECDRLGNDLGSAHPSALPAAEQYAATWALLLNRTLQSLPSVDESVQLTRPLRVVLGRIARQAKYETFGTEFKTPRPGTKRERRLANLDDQTGAEIAGLLSRYVEPADRRKIITALRTGQTAPLETVIRLLPKADLAEARDC